MKKLTEYLSVPVLFFLLVVFVANLSGLFVAKHPSGGFPYHEYASREKLPEIIRFLTNFDGTQYIIIAESGYFTYQQAYFPLYPAISSLIGRFLLADNIPLALIFASFFSFIVAFGFLRKLFEDKEFGELKSLNKFGVYLILMLPGSFFFAAAYTESVFLALLLACLYFAKKGNLTASFLTGISLGLTRLVGSFASILIFAANSKSAKSYARLAMALSPILGLLIYMFYLQTTTGDALAFVSSQKAFNNGRSTNIVLLPQVLYRYLKIILTVRNFDVVYLVSVIEFTTFCVYASLLAFESFSLWRVWRSGHMILQSRVSLLVFSIINLILPTLTGTLSSIPRYGLMSFSIIPAIFALNKYFRFALLLLLMTINILMLMLFAQGWFVS